MSSPICPYMSYPMSIYIIYIIYIYLYRHIYIYVYIYIPICPLYIYIQSPIWAAPLYTPLTGLGQWHNRTTHSYSCNLSWSCTTSLASSCNWSCNQVYSHNKSCQWSGKVVQLSYDRRILRSATTMKDHQRLVPRPSHDRRTTTDD